MLCKSNVNITYPKSETKGNFLSQMTDKIIDEACPQLIMSIGTTGGCQINDKPEFQQLLLKITTDL